MYQDKSENQFELMARRLPDAVAVMRGDALTHYDPEGCPHPYHAGDLPPLFGAGDLAFLAVLTNRFALDEVIGKTLILHDRPDDFTSQPSGNAGGKIACGVITRVAR